MDNKQEKAYAPKEISLALDISDSTLRKWCLALEKNGYGFIRNDKKNRVFVESDILVLKHFQNLVKQHNMQLDNAAKLVIDRFGKGTFEVRTDIVPAEKEENERDLDRSNDEVLSTLLEYIRTQEAFNQELVHRLDQQQKYIDERLEERDKKLMQSVRKSQEERQAILQIAAAQENDKRKGFLARLFNK